MRHPTDSHRWSDRVVVAFATLFTLDRLAKLAAVVHFMRRSPPSPPQPWPSVTLLQPITRSQHDLRRALESRARLDYPAATQHLLICDAADTHSQAICQAVMAAHPSWPAEVLLAEPDAGALASKIVKLQTALPHAHGTVLVFVDDDVILRPDALRLLIPNVMSTEIGAAFGLACYTDWRTPGSSLMSAFVNANALLSYLPLTYLTEPFTITGHCFALRRTVFTAIGGLNDMAQRVDDDHELARRVRRAGLRIVQTPLIYDVENRLGSLRDYQVQLKRWFILPRQTMLPQLTRRERAVLLLGSVGNLLPGSLALLALFSRRRVAWRALSLCLVIFAAVYALGERVYLRRSTPLHRWPLVLIVALITPWQALAATLADDTIEWRGQRWRIWRGGEFDVLDSGGADQTDNY